MPGIPKIMPFGNLDMKDTFQMMDFLNKGGFEQSQSESNSQDLVKMLQYAKIIGKAQEMDQENSKDDYKKVPF